MARTAMVSAVLALGCVSLTGEAQAQPQPNGSGGYYLDFTQNIGSNPAPAGTPAWLTADINAIAGGVSIELISRLKSSTEFITAVAFNLTNAISPWGQSSWACDTSSQITCSSAKVDVLQDFNNPPDINLENGAKSFDLAIYLPKSNSEDRLMGNDRAKFNIFGTGLTPASFLSTNVPLFPGTVPGLWAAAKVQGTDSDGRGSTTIADPPAAVPGPLPLLGAGVALGLARRLRQRLAIAA